VSIEYSLLRILLILLLYTVYYAPNDRPPESRSSTNPWPQWPRIYGVDYGHAEVMAVFGQDPRQYSITTAEFLSDSTNSRVTGLKTQEVKLNSKGIMERVPNTEKIWPADLVILSMGFVSPELTISQKLGLDIDQRNNIHAEYGDFRTSVEGVFAAGDCRRGQSLVVWAINEGRGVAKACHNFLQEKQLKDDTGHQYGNDQQMYVI
jgi:glutamate synthase (NADPH) small chain